MKFSAVKRHEPGKALQQNGLAAPAAAQQAGDLRPGHLQVDALKHRMIAKGLAQVSGFEEWRWGAHSIREVMT